MKQCKPLWIMTVFLLCLSLTACQGSDLGEPPVPMEQTLVMDDREQYTTFRIQAPKGWFFVSEAPADMKLYDMNVLTPFIDLEQDPEHFIWIHKYNLMYDEPTPEPWLRDIFSGNYDKYEEDYRSYYKMRSEELDFPPPEIEFEYSFYQGISGKFVVIHIISPSFLGTENYHSVACYFEDIPYMMNSDIDDTAELSGGEIIPWIASTFQVTEHYRIVDGEMIKDATSN